MWVHTGFGEWKIPKSYRLTGPVELAVDRNIYRSISLSATTGGKRLRRALLAKRRKAEFAPLCVLSAIMLTERVGRLAAATQNGCKALSPSWTFPPAYRNISLVRFLNVLCLALECLFTERPAVETHIVEVCPCIIDDVKAVALVLFLARLMRKPLPMSIKSLLPVMAAKRLPPICCKIVFAIIIFLVLWLAVRTPPTCSKFCFLGYGCFVPAIFHTLHIVLARDDCRMAVNGGKPTAS